MLNEQQIATAIKNALAEYRIASDSCAIVHFSDVVGAIVEVREKGWNTDIDAVYSEGKIEFSIKDYGFDMCYADSFDPQRVASVEDLKWLVEDGLQTHIEHSLGLFL